MTTTQREFYDQIYIWSLLSLSTDDYNNWYYKVSRPSSIDYPDGLFYSVTECKEYFNFE